MHGFCISAIYDNKLPFSFSSLSFSFFFHHHHAFSEMIKITLQTNFRVHNTVTRVLIAFKVHADTHVVS